MATTNKALLETALNDYRLAYEELNRPEHDVMYNSVCHLSREAICSLLRMQLEKHDISYDVNSDMAALIDLGRNNFPALNEIDFNSIVCGKLSLEDDSANYCLNETRIHSCFKVLETLKGQLIDGK